LRIDVNLEDVTADEWGGEFVPIHIDGCILDETVFVHPSSRTLITADLAENFATAEGWYTRTYLKIAGIHGRVGFSRVLRPVYRDKAKALQSIDRLLECDFDRVILAHGDPIRVSGREAIRETYAWMKS
jgi:hypothetical protein